MIVLRIDKTSVSQQNNFKFIGNLLESKEVLKKDFLNIMLRNEEYLLTKNKRIFETMSIL